MTRPRRPPATRRRLRVPLIVGAVLALVVLVLAVVSVARARAADDRMAAVRDSLTITDGWVLVDESVRTSGFLGLCFASALDVRDCPSAVVTYAVDGMPESIASLESVLPGQEWIVQDPDCAAVPVNVSGRFDTCTASTALSGLRVEIGASVEVAQGGVTSAPRVTVSIRPE